MVSQLAAELKYKGFGVKIHQESKIWCYFIISLEALLVDPSKPNTSNKDFRKFALGQGYASKEEALTNACKYVDKIVERNN